jgi:hypothetical protein
MLSKETKLRLVHAVTDQKTADEIERRLLSSTPANPAASQAILDSLNESLSASIQERIVIALAGDNAGAAGREIAQKLNLMVQVLKAHADGEEVAAVAAAFTGQVAGMATDVTIEADNAGAAGNSISLSFDGLTTVSDAIDAWNLANPANTATLAAGDGSQTPDNAESIDLSGGSDASDANTAAAQAAMGAEEMSVAAKFCLVHALASQQAADELEAAYNAMVAAVQAITP